MQINRQNTSLQFGKIELQRIDPKVENSYRLIISTEEPDTLIIGKGCPEPTPLKDPPSDFIQSLIKMYETAPLTLMAAQGILLLLFGMVIPPGQIKESNKKILKEGGKKTIQAEYAFYEPTIARPNPTVVELKRRQVPRQPNGQDGS